MKREEIINKITNSIYQIKNHDLENIKKVKEREGKHSLYLTVCYSINFGWVCTFQRDNPFIINNNNIQQINTTDLYCGIRYFSSVLIEIDHILSDSFSPEKYATAFFKEYQSKVSLTN